MPDTDPNEVRLTGENSFIRLLLEANGPEVTRVSHWRILHCPGGPGHVLFIQSDVTDNTVRIYSDNIAVTRWLQEEIESLLHPPFADQTTPEDTPRTIGFTVGDAEAPVTTLAVTATSSNGALLPGGSLTLGGAGANRTLTLTPAASSDCRSSDPAASAGAAEVLPR